LGGDEAAVEELSEGDWGLKSFTWRRGGGGGREGNAGPEGEK